MDEFNLQHLNDVDMIKIDNNIDGDVNEYGLKVVDKNTILKDLELSEDMENFMNDLIFNYEKNVAKHVANYQSTTLVYMGRITLNHVTAVKKEHKDMLNFIYTNKNKESYKIYTKSLARRAFQERTDGRIHVSKIGNIYHPSKLNEGLLELRDKDNNMVRLNLTNYLKIVTNKNLKPLKIPKKYEL